MTVLSSPITPSPSVVDQSADFDRLIAHLVEKPASRYAILDPTFIDRTSLISRILDSPRVRNHFSQRCIFVSCAGARNTDDIVTRLAAKLSIASNSDHMKAVLENLTAHRKTLIALDKLDVVYSLDNRDEQDAADVMLACLASIDELSLLVTYCGPSLPESVMWENTNLIVNDMLIKSGLGEVPPPAFLIGKYDTPPPIGNANYEQIFTQYSDVPMTQYRFQQELPGPLTPVGPRKIAQSRVPPAKPAVFHGRGKEVEQLVAQVLAGNTAPIGITGPGGIGKTTLALKILHDPRICMRFGKDRYFVSCDGASSPNEVLAQFALKLGVQRSRDASLWSVVIDDVRSRQRVFLVLDNFETIWSPTDQVLRDEAEIFLAQLVVLDELTLLVTTRGNYLPSDFTWANVDTAELDTLSSTAARHTFEDLSYIEPDILGSEPESEALTKLLREVDFMPLAITLLARLDDLPSRLLREWSEHYTEVLEADRHDGTRRELSVEVSIKISLAHLPAESEDIQPRRLLSVLGQLPAGLFPAVSAKLCDTIFDVDVAAHKLLRHSLVFVSGQGELRMLSPVRHHIARAFPMLRETQSTVEKIYLAMASAHPQITRPGVDGPTYDDEIQNIVSILTAAVDRPSADFVATVIDFAVYCGFRGHPCLLLLHRLLQRIGHSPTRTAQCFIGIALQHRAVEDIDMAIGFFERAVDILAGLRPRSPLEITAREMLACLLNDVGRHQEEDNQLSIVNQLMGESRSPSYQQMIAQGQDVSAVEHYYRAARDACLQAGDDRGFFQTTERILHIVSERDGPEGHIKELELICALGGQSMSGCSLIAMHKLILARRYTDCGKLDRAETLLIEAHAAFLENGERNGSNMATCAFAFLRLKQRCVPEAIELFQTAAELHRKCNAFSIAELCMKYARELQNGSLDT